MSESDARPVLFADRGKWWLLNLGSAAASNVCAEVEPPASEGETEDEAGPSSELGLIADRLARGHQCEVDPRGFDQSPHETVTVQLTWDDPDGTRHAERYTVTAKRASVPATYRRSPPEAPRITTIVEPTEPVLVETQEMPPAPPAPRATPRPRRRTQPAKEQRAAIHASVSDEAFEFWHELAGGEGVSLSALLEVLSAELAALVTEDQIRRSRRVDAQRRRRGW